MRRRTIVLSHPRLSSFEINALSGRLSGVLFGETVAQKIPSDNEEGHRRGVRTRPQEGQFGRVAGHRRNHATLKTLTHFRNEWVRVFRFLRLDGNATVQTERATRTLTNA